MNRRGRLALIAGLTVFLTGIGATAGYALWSTSATTSAQVRAATVSLSVDGAASTPLSGQYRSGTTLTAPVTLTNSGTVGLSYTASVVSTGGNLAPGSVSIRIWKVAQVADCQPTSVTPASAWSGTFAGLGSAPSEQLAAGAGQVLCVRTAATVTQEQQGMTATADLVFTGSNGWQTSGAVSMSPTVYAVPAPVLLDGIAGCSDTASQKTVTLGWSGVSGATSYRLYFSPAVTPTPSPGYLQVNGTGATISGEHFDTVAGSQNGSGSVTIRALVDGWESTGLVRSIYFAPNSRGANAKISCSAF